MLHDARVPRAYVLLHGLTASPLQFENFGKMLFERGANVWIPRLPHHGYGDRLTAALADLTADELTEFAAATCEHARSLADEVVVVGFSVGGLLAAWIAQHCAVERAVAIAPFLGVAWLPRRLTTPIAALALRTPNRYLWWDPIRRAALMPAHGYPRFPTHALAHAAYVGQALLREAAARRPAARRVAIVLNDREAAVSNAAARTLARAWTRTMKRPVLHGLKGLPASHDIIEPLRNPNIVRRLYPALLDFVDR